MSGVLSVEAQSRINMEARYDAGQGKLDMGNRRGERAQAYCEAYQERFRERLWKLNDELNKLHEQAELLAGHNKAAELTGVQDPKALAVRLRAMLDVFSGVEGL